MSGKEIVLFIYCLFFFSFGALHNLSVIKVNTELLIVVRDTSGPCSEKEIIIMISIIFV